MLSAKLNLLFLRYLMTLRSLILNSTSDKAKSSAGSFSENSVVDDTVGCLPAFTSGTNQKQTGIFPNIFYYLYSVVKAQSSVEF